MYYVLQYEKTIALFHMFQKIQLTIIMWLTWMGLQISIYVSNKVE